MTVTIYVDYRETRSQVLRFLDLKGVNLNIQELEVGDFILSERCGCERKTGDDALSSFIGEEKGKIFRQCHDLVKAYERPILLLECDLPELFSRNIHPGAIWGMLRSIIWNGCAIEFTYNAEGTAKRLYELAKLEQEGNSKEFSPHGSKTKRTKNEQLTYTLSSVTDIGTAKATNLLTHFKSLKAIANADIEQLIEVDLIGKPTATHIKEFFEREFK